MDYENFYSRIEGFIKWCMKTTPDTKEVYYIHYQIKDIYEKYGIELPEIIQDIVLNFVRLDHEQKWNEKKYTESSFIKHYIYYTIKNLKKEYARHGMSYSQKSKQMDCMNGKLRQRKFEVGRKIEEINIMDFEEYVDRLVPSGGMDPEECAILKQEFETAIKLIGFENVDLLIGKISVSDRANQLGISEREVYNRMKTNRRLLIEELGNDSVFINFMC